MSLITSPELFINMKSIPDPSSQEYDAFFQEELRKIEYGVTINGVFIDPWIYWHICHWNIHIDIEDKINKIVKRELSHPLLRDNEWIIGEYRAKSIEQKKGLFLCGSRRLGKSEAEASIIGRSSTIYQGSENVVSGGNTSDIKLITDKLDKGLNNIHPYFRFSRIEDNWRSQVTLGVKEKSGRKYPWSYILIRNYDDGQNTEAAAGITAKEFIIDEAAKFNFLRCLEAAIPAFTSPYGWRCSPLIVCTGGSFEKGADAEKVFNNPEAYNMLAVEVKDEPKKYGLFIPGLYRMEAKEETTLAEYAKEKLEQNIPDDSELHLVKFLKTNEDKARELITSEREKAKKARDSDTLLKAIMYYPLTPQECFLTSGNNYYDGELARIQQKRLLDKGITGSCVWLKHDGEKIIHEFTDKKPISNFPCLGGEDKDAPIVIWEMPILNPPFGLYVIGADPYRQANSEYSDSLGAIYVFKRMHDIAGEKVQDAFVASYVARPKDKKKWEEQARLLIKYYNARTLCENDEVSFIDYMISKGDGHYLEPQPSWLREIVPNTTVNREKGIHRSSERIREHLRSNFKKYMEEVIHVEKDENGSVVREVLGVNRIPDPMLLEEVSKWTPDINVDRCVAAELAITMARHLDPIMGKISSTEEDPRYKSYFERNKKSSSLFKESPSPLRHKGSRIKRLFH